jgi:16S rRNA (uracil1498-N3)-methyltransferase
MNTFLASRIEKNTLLLNADESWHCVKVLRMQGGDEIRVIDGHGRSFRAQLVVLNEKQCVAEIIEELEKEIPSFQLHIAIAPTKNMDRIEWFAEKATELGVSAISFIICRNSERTVIKTERIRKIVEAAVKQSMRSVIPVVNDAVKFKQFMEAEHKGSRFIAHCADDIKLDLGAALNGKREALILIGPEGDFSAEEITAARNTGFSPVTLGNTRLRTETAGIYAAAVARAYTSLSHT